MQSCHSTTPHLLSDTPTKTINVNVHLLSSLLPFFLKLSELVNNLLNQTVKKKETLDSSLWGVHFSFLALSKNCNTEMLL